MNFQRFYGSRLFDVATGDPQGGGGTPPAADPVAPPAAFDAAAFLATLKTDLLTDLKKEFNGGINALDKKIKGLHELITPKPADPPVAPPTPKAGDPVQPVSPEVLEMRKQLDRLTGELTQTREERAKDQLHSAVLNEIAKLSFANPARDTKDLLRLVISDVKRGDDGSFYGPEGVALEQYIKSEYDGRPNWHPAVKVNGSGAPPSSSAPAPKKIDMDDIKAGASKESLQAAALQIAGLLRG